MKIMKAAALALCGCLFAAGANARTELEVQYPYGGTFDLLMDQLKTNFEKKNPDITIRYRTSYRSYEEGTQRLMREAITKQMPDVSFQGLNRVQALYDRQIPVALDDFLTEEDRSKYGYDDVMLTPARFDGKTYAMPFSVSLPVMFYNMNLVKQATGNEELPDNWDDVLKLAAQIHDLDSGISGIYYDWHMTGSWLWLAPLMSQGETPLDEQGKVNFDNETGRWTLELMSRIVQEGKMPDYTTATADTAFTAGNIGIYVGSTGSLGQFERMKGDRFELKTGQFPDVVEGGTLPVGGNGAVIVTRDKERQKAAWRFIRYITGPEGNALIPPVTGYMAPNPVAAASLEDFLQENPNYNTVVKQLPLMDTWHSFPGRNGMKITDMIQDHLQTIFNGQRANDINTINKEMARDVSRQLPRS